jgi:acetoacetate decarboxylase
MAYKQISLATKLNKVARRYWPTQRQPKAAARRRWQVAQLVAYNLEDILVHGAWDGHARLHLIPACQLPRRRLARATGCWGPPSNRGLRAPLWTCAA